MSTTVDLTHPAEVMARLEQIDQDLATRQNAFEAAARGWYVAKRDLEKARATAFLNADGSSVTERKMAADLAACSLEGAEHEAEYEALKAVVRVLETRASVCMSLLKAQGRIA